MSTIREFEDEVSEVNQVHCELERYKQQIKETSGEKDKRIKRINQILFIMSKSDLGEIKKQAKERYAKEESTKFCEYIEKIERKEELNFEEINELRFCLKDCKIEKMEKISFSSIMKKIWRR